MKPWIAAYTAQDADKYFSLFADDAEFMDTTDPGFGATGPQKVRDLQGEFRGSTGSIWFKFTSYFISPDGGFAAAQGAFTTYSIGDVVTVPIVSILELKDGKINKETQYFDGSRIY